MFKDLKEVKELNKKAWDWLGFNNKKQQSEEIKERGGNGKFKSGYIKIESKLLFSRYIIISWRNWKNDRILCYQVRIVESDGDINSTNKLSKQEFKTLKDAKLALALYIFKGETYDNNDNDTD